MRKFIKNYLSKLIREISSEESLQNSENHNPYGIQLSQNSIVDTEFKIENGSKISIGKNSYIGRNAWLGVYDSVYNKDRISIEVGEDVTIGNYACITSINSIKIGTGCLISEYFYVSDHTHGFDPSQNTKPLDQPLSSKGEVSIGKNCFIGFRVSILPGVTIGKNCVIGSHAVVADNIPDYCMAAGVPARVIKKYNFQSNQWEKI